jgi:phosphatidylinositol alpha-mannosyltransferase
MGGSALRAMAFAKPVVVLGEDGFAAILGPHTVEQFLWQGFYGLGDGDTDPRELARLIDDLLSDPARRHQLGEYARQLVVTRFDVRAEAERLEEIYAHALATPRRALSTARDVVTSANGLVIHKLNRRMAARRGALATDDMNAKAAIRRRWSAERAR